MISRRHLYSLLISNVIFALSSAAKSKGKSLSNLDYSTYPLRKSEEAAVIEWGNSAVISALEAAVAGFGPQTSRGAFFEVSKSIIFKIAKSDVLEKLINF